MKPLIISHSHNGLRALASLGLMSGLKGVYQLDLASGHAMRLNSWTGIEGLPVSSINCDRLLH